MNKTTIKKEVTKFKTKLLKKVKFQSSPNKESILEFVFGSTKDLVSQLMMEFELQPSFDIKERLNELVEI